MPVKKLKAQSSKRKTTAQSSKVQKKDKTVELKIKSTSKLTIDVFDVKGKVAGEMALPKEIFGAEENKQLIAQAVRVYLANQRRGTVNTKTRGEVAGSTRKIYRQKGTGRARHGGIRAPIFVHGGIAHGPRPRDYSLSMPRKMKKQALFSALSTVYKAGGIKVITGLEKMKPKTKVMVEVLHNLELLAKKRKKILLVLPTKVETVEKAARNISGVTLMFATQMNTYEVLKNQVLLFMQDSVKTLESHYDS